MLEWKLKILQLEKMNKFGTNTLHDTNTHTHTFSLFELFSFFCISDKLLSICHLFRRQFSCLPGWNTAGLFCLLHFILEPCTSAGLCRAHQSWPPNFSQKGGTRRNKDPGDLFYLSLSGVSGHTSGIASVIPRTISYPNLFWIFSYSSNSAVHRRGLHFLGELKWQD